MEHGKEEGLSEQWGLPGSAGRTPALRQRVWADWLARCPSAGVELAKQCCDLAFSHGWIGGVLVGCIAFFLEGVIPVLSVPNIEGTNDWILGEALALAAKKSLVGVEDHVVCLMAMRDSYSLKIVSMDELNRGQVSRKQGKQPSAFLSIWVSSCYLLHLCDYICPWLKRSRAQQIQFLCFSLPNPSCFRNDAKMKHKPDQQNLDRV